MRQAVFGKPGRGGDNSAAHTAACKAIREYLLLLGGWEFKVTGSYFQRAGCPDILACVPPFGALLGIEVKTGAGEPTEEQIRELHAINRSGGIGIIVSNVDELDETLYATGVIDRRMNQSYQRPLPLVAGPEDQPD